MSQPSKPRVQIPALGPVQSRFPASILRSREQGSKVNVIEPVNFRAKKPAKNSKNSKRAQYTRSVAIVASKSSVDIPETARRRSKNIGQFFTDLASVKKKVDGNLRAFIEDIEETGLKNTSQIVSQLSKTAEEFLDKKPSQIWYVLN